MVVRKAIRKRARRSNKVFNATESGTGLMLAFQQRPGALQRNRLALPSHPRVGILLKDKERPRRRRFNRDLFRGPDV